MVKPIKKLIKEIKITLDNPEDNKDFPLEKILKSWAESIIDECAGNFECTMDDSEDVMGFRVGEHPVLVRQSVLDVIKQIK